MLTFKLLIKYEVFYFNFIINFAHKEFLESKK